MAALCGLLVVVPGSAIPARADDTVLDRSIAAGGARVLQIGSGGADIVLTPADDPAGPVRVVVTQSGSAPVPHFATSRAANRLIVTIEAPDHSLMPFASTTSVMQYNVTYPARMRLDLRATSGNVKIQNPRSAVEAFDEEGNIAVVSPRSAVTVENVHGDVAVSHAASSIDLASDSGSVTADLTDNWTGAEVRMQSDAGELRLAIPSSLRARIDAYTGATIHNAFGRSTATSPLVWLHSQTGDVWIELAQH
jgi:hypothetical protein